MVRTYADAGVSQDEKAAHIAALVSALTYRRRGLGKPLTQIGHFTGLVDFGAYALSLCTDSVGTKVLVAKEMRRWDTIGIDCVAMNVNDMICIGAKGRVIAVDLATISPIEGVEILRGDFTRPEVQAELFETLRKPADVVMSDTAPKLSGNRSLDVARTLDLADVALSFAVRALRPNGRFLVKVFQGDGYPPFIRRVGERFEATKGVKPTASTSTSAEIYILAVGRL